MSDCAVIFTAADAAALMVDHARHQLGIGSDQGWSFDMVFSPEGEISFVVTFAEPPARPASSSTQLTQAHRAEEPDVL